MNFVIFLCNSTALYMLKVKETMKTLMGKYNVSMCSVFTYTKGLHILLCQVHRNKIGGFNVTLLAPVHTELLLEFEGLQEGEGKKRLSIFSKEITFLLSI